MPQDSPTGRSDSAEAGIGEGVLSSVRVGGAGGTRTPGLLTASQTALPTELQPHGLQAARHRTWGPGEAPAQPGLPTRHIFHSRLTRSGNVEESPLSLPLRRGIEGAVDLIVECSTELNRP